jgi:hypothetical protein
MRGVGLRKMARYEARSAARAVTKARADQRDLALAPIIAEIQATV